MWQKVDVARKIDLLDHLHNKRKNCYHQASWLLILIDLTSSPLVL